MKVNQKKIQKGKILDVLRWCALLPAACVTWYFVWFLALGGMYGILLGVPELLNCNFFIWFMMIMTVFVLPAVVNFFVVRLIAPTNKKIFAWASVALCAVWAFCFIYGMMHTAY